MTAQALVPAPGDELRLSWRRSVEYGLARASALPARVRGHAPGDTVILRAARAVVAERAVTQESPVAIVLTDADGMLIGRWCENRSFSEVLDRLRIRVGHHLSEETVGTTGPGLALDTLRPSLVVGDEHFATAAAGLVSAGAVVRSRSGRRMAGAIGVVADVSQAGPFLLPWVEDLARLVEASARAAGTERLLVDAYLKAAKGSRKPLLCLSEDVVLANAAGARALSRLGHTTLSETAAQALEPGRREPLSLTLDGESVEINCTPIMDDETARGVLVRIHHEPRLRIVPGAQADPRPVERIPGLVGSSAAWLRTCRPVAQLNASGEPVILVGELGSGKTAIANSMLARHATVDRFDCSGADWSQQLAHVSGSTADALLVENLDALDDLGYDRLCRVLDGRVGTVRIIATARPRPTVELSPDDIVDIRGFPGRSLRIPPLRERLEDLPELLSTFTAARMPGRMPATWRSDAVQALSRVPWSANVASVEKVVEVVLARSTRTSIAMTDLPARIQALAARRALTGLERSEAHAITFGLRAFGGNKQATASALGIARSTLYRKMRALGIDLDIVMY